MTTTTLADRRAQQARLYGAPLAVRIFRLLRILDVTQARLAGTLGVSPALLSQWISGHRVTITDPTVLSRLVILDLRTRRDVVIDVDALLGEIAEMQWEWPAR